MDYGLFSPTDFRYGVEDLKPYLTEERFTKYKVMVEAALLKTLAKHGICPIGVAEEVDGLADKVLTEDVYKEEGRIKHDIRALVNEIKKYLSEGAKPFVHVPATSYDIVEPARALMYRDAAYDVILPDMIDLEYILIGLAREEKDTVQIGRTHGQHAEPITFGFAIAEYVDRWGGRILKVKEAADGLVGKFSGAVGAYNASSLLVEDPEKFEEDLLAELGLKPARISTQIAPPEPTTDFIHAVISSWGVLANYADDMRHLQRTEIGEVGEPFGGEQVGSSTMPHKKNPINFENVKSAWKAFMPRIITAYLDQVSEHQRDLTNSLSQRYIPELLVVFDSSVRRMGKISGKLQVDGANMRRNFEMSSDKVGAEPLQIMLSYHGYPDAHEKIRQLTMESYRTGEPLGRIVSGDEEIRPFLDKFNEKQREMVFSPEKYVGIAAQKAESVCDYWEACMDRLGE